MGISGERAKRWSLAAPRGYQELMSLRNRAQSDDVNSKARDGLPVWQRLTAKLGRASLKTAKQDVCSGSRTIRITVPASHDAPGMQINVLRPEQQTDDLVVELDGAVLDRVTGFITEQGFDEDLQPPPRDPALPKFVYRRGTSFVARLPGKRAKTAKTLEYLQEQMQVIEMESDDDTPPPDT